MENLRFVLLVAGPMLAAAFGLLVEGVVGKQTKAVEVVILAVFLLVYYLALGLFRRRNRRK